jgi:hypothetical protein
MDIKPALMLGTLALALAGCSSSVISQNAAPSTAAATSIATQAGSTPSAPSAHSAALTAEQIAQRMNLHSVTAYTAATDPNHLLGRQGGYASKINWPNGSIEVFSTPAEAQKRKAYLQAFAGTPFGDGYDYLVGTYLLRIFDSQTPAQAHALEAKFLKITSSRSRRTIQTAADACDNRRDASGDIYVRMIQPGISSQAQELGGEWRWDSTINKCLTSVQLMIATAPHTPGTCTQVGYVVDNPGYNVNAASAPPLKNVVAETGPAC